MSTSNCLALTTNPYRSVRVLPRVETDAQAPGFPHPKEVLRDIDAERRLSVYNRERKAALIKPAEQPTRGCDVDKKAGRFDSVLRREEGYGVRSRAKNSTRRPNF